MDSLRQYILGIIVTALICGVVSSVVKNTFAGEAIRQICGVFLLCSLIKPIAWLDMDALLNQSGIFTKEAEAAAEEGKNMAADTLARLIKEETEAYILDKATSIKAQVTVEITLDQKCVPVSADLHGIVSPHQRTILSSILEEELGITKENQQWTG